MQLREEERGKFLCNKLVNDKRLFKLYDVLAEKPKDIEEVANYVFSDINDNALREQALIDLIELAAAAKNSEDESALLPARYHLFVKSLEGLFVEYYPEKRVFLDRKEKFVDNSGEYSVFEMANCQKCGQEYILGKTIKKANKNYLVQTSSMEKPEFYFISDTDIDETFDEDDDLDEKSNFSSFGKYRLCLSCGYAVNTIPDKSWPTYVYYECPECKRIYPPKSKMTEVTIDISEDVELCPACQAEMKARKFIIPIFGFSTSYKENPKQVGETRPKAYYATQTQFWSDTDLSESQQREVKSRIINFKGKEVSAKYSPGGKLFVLNQGTNGAGLYVCPECGFTTEVDKIPKNGHSNKYGRRCPNKELQRVSLGHQFSTDILKIQLPDHWVEQPLAGSLEYKDQYLSVLYALLEGASAALDINRSDISGCIIGEGQMVLYDDTPGGSGFVKHIFEHLEVVIAKAKEKVNGNCGCTEETSCYGCLRNYGNQFFHDVLSRGVAYRYLDWLLNETYEKNFSDMRECDISMLRVGGWFFYLSGEEGKLRSDVSGKWII